MRRVQARLEREANARGEELDGHQLRAQIAREVGVPLHDVEMMQGRLSGSDFSLNATNPRMRRGASGSTRWRMRIRTPPARSSTPRDTGTLRAWLAEALGALNDRERYIVAERKLRDEPRTLESLGQEMGLSKERIRQLEAAAFNKMRKTLSQKGLRFRNCWPDAGGAGGSGVGCCHTGGGPSGSMHRRWRRFRRRIS